jgi:phage terminase large subunit-like protein
LLSASLASATTEQQTRFLQGLTPQEAEALLYAWDVWARDDQLPPDPDDTWTTWLLLGGRGAGKTRAGAEWIRAHTHEPIRIALIGETLADVRDVMVEGPSGLIDIAPPHERPKWIASKRRVEWPSGAQALAFSSEDPEALRGHQAHIAWGDEFAKWRHMQETWDMLQFGLRLGDMPRQVVTTTPRPAPALKRLLVDPATRVSRAATIANAANLAPGFLRTVARLYGGTRLGRQELNAELLEDNPNALWQRDLIDRARLASAPPLRRIVVAVDPPATSSPRADECGIVVAGADDKGHGYILADRSAGGLSPARWARRVADAFHAYEADRVVAEVNQGGEMVEAVLRQVDQSLPVRHVRATRGKAVRAEPVAALYEQNRIHHIGAHPRLEDQLCEFDPSVPGQSGSPDRLDALVWALTDLMLGPNASEPRLRSL